MGACTGYWRGPGRYSRWLCDMGYQATLADLSPNLLDIARAEFGEDRIREIVEADVRDLSRWSDNTFDSTIALGPFYHLTSAADRRKALEELMRVTMPGGTIAVALMSKYALLRRTLSIRDERHRMAEASFVEALLSRGTYDNPIPGRFTEGYGVEPSKAAKSFEEAGLITEIVASTHGFATGLEDQIENLRSEDPDAYVSTLEVLKATATDPSLLGTAGHLLYIGRNAPR
ncbi:class I SAM-dependent methyltransferase [Arthrobacter sp. FX8]|uniref:class I SAM-dependent methyltransferase n=1 Tax=Arthrobacter sp. FX8 TaxID=2997335 RepID=UPI003FA37645